MLHYTVYDSNFTLQNSQTLHADHCHHPVHVYNNFFDLAGKPIHECICLLNRQRDMRLQNKQKVMWLISVNSALVAVRAAGFLMVCITLCSAFWVRSFPVCVWAWQECRISETHTQSVRVEVSASDPTNRFVSMCCTSDCKPLLYTLPTTPLLQFCALPLHFHASITHLPAGTQDFEKEGYDRTQVKPHPHLMTTPIVMWLSLLC